VVAPAIEDDVVSLSASGLQLGGGQIVHTAIVDGGGALDMHNLAKTAFNARNWIYP